LEGAVKRTLLALALAACSPYENDQLRKTTPVGVAPSPGKVTFRIDNPPAFLLHGEQADYLLGEVRGGRNPKAVLCLYGSTAELESALHGDTKNYHDATALVQPGNHLWRVAIKQCDEMNLAYRAAQPSIVPLSQLPSYVPR